MGSMGTLRKILKLHFSEENATIYICLFLHFLLSKESRLIIY